MFSNQNIVCAVEFGTSKISVLIGELTAKNKVELIGSGAVASGNAVVKGEISDMKRAVEVLRKAFDIAEKKADCNLSDCRVITVAVAGCGITSHQETARITVVFLLP